MKRQKTAMETVVEIEPPYHSQFYWVIYRVCLFYLKVKWFIRPKTRWIINGEEVLQQNCDRPIVFVVNHVSVVDPLLVAGVLQMKLGAPVFSMGRAELFGDIPGIKQKWWERIIAKYSGFLYPKCGVFPVIRGTADTHAIRQARKLLEAGKKVVIFYEGEISKDGTLKPPKHGAGHLSKIAEISPKPIIICLYIRGTGARWRIGWGKFLRYKGRREFTFVEKSFEIEKDLSTREARESIVTQAWEAMWQVGSRVWGVDPELFKPSSQK